MPPAQRHTVVRMGRSTPRMLGHVVDLTPRCRHMTPRNQTFLIAGDDRPTLVDGEHPVSGGDRDDPALVEEDTLDRSGARDLRGDRHRHVCSGSGDRCPAGGVAPPDSLARRVGGDVLRIDVDDEHRRRTAECGHVLMTRGDPEHGSERIVALLRRGAVIDHAPRIGVERVIAARIVAARREAHPGHGRSVGFGVEERVHDQLQLRRDLRGQIPADRVHAILQPADRDPSATTRVLILGFFSIGVEHRRQVFGEALQILRGRRRTGPLLAAFQVAPVVENQTVPARGTRQRDVGGQPLIDTDPLPHLLDRSRRRQESRDSDRPVQQGQPHLMPPRREPLPCQAHRTPDPIDDPVDQSRSPRLHR